MNLFSFFNLRTLLLCAVGVTLLTACESGGNEPEVPAELSLELDKAAYDFGEPVRFTVKRGAEDVSSQAQVEIKGVHGSVGKATVSWTSGRSGAFSFVASLEGKISNEAKCEVKRPATQYKRRVLGIDFTGTGCKPCAQMTTVLNEYERKNPDVLVVMGAHVNNPEPDIMSTAETEELGAMVDIYTRGTPNLWVDCREELVSFDPATIESFVQNSLKNYYSVCGIAAESKVEGRTVKVDATLHFAEEGDFKVCAVLLEDNITALASAEGIYHHAVRKFATDIMGDAIGTFKAGAEHKMSFSFDAAARWKLEDCHVLIYVFNRCGEAYYVNNVKVCPADGKVALD